MVVQQQFFPRSILVKRKITLWTMILFQIGGKASDKLDAPSGHSKGKALCQNWINGYEGGIAEKLNVVQQSMFFVGGTVVGGFICPQYSCPFLTLSLINFCTPSPFHSFHHQWAPWACFKGPWSMLEQISSDLWNSCRRIMVLLHL